VEGAVSGSAIEGIGRVVDAGFGWVCEAGTAFARRARTTLLWVFAGRAVLPGARLVFGLADTRAAEVRAFARLAAGCFLALTFRTGRTPAFERFNALFFLVVFVDRDRTDFIENSRSAPRALGFNAKDNKSSSEKAQPRNS